MEDIVRFLLYSVLHGAFILVIGFLIFKSIGIGDKFISKSVFIRAVSYTMLISSLIYVVWFLCSLISAFFSAGEYVQYTTMNHFFGSYWFAFWLFLFLPHYLLPQIFWIRKLRQNISAVLIIALIWELSFTIKMYTPYAFGGFSSWRIYFTAKWSDYLIPFFCYLPIVSAVYFVITLKEKREIKPNL